MYYDLSITNRIREPYLNPKVENSLSSLNEFEALILLLDSFSCVSEFIQVFLYFLVTIVFVGIGGSQKWYVLCDQLICYLTFQVLLIPLERLLTRNQFIAEQKWKTRTVFYTALQQSLGVRSLLLSNRYEDYIKEKIRHKQQDYLRWNLDENIFDPIRPFICQILAGTPLAVTYYIMTLLKSGYSPMTAIWEFNSIKIRLVTLNFLTLSSLANAIIDDRSNKVRFHKTVSQIEMMKPYVRHEFNKPFTKLTLRNVSLSVYKQVESLEPDLVKIKDNITFEFPKGSKTVIRAPSGTGKSLLLVRISGKYNQEFPDGGIYLDNYKVSPLELRSITYYVPSQPEFCVQTLRTNLTMRTAHTDEELKQILSAYNLNESAKDLDKIVSSSSYSEGEKKRLALARMELELKNDSDRIILLDEAFANLDEERIKVVMGRIKDLANTVIMTSHESLVCENFRTLDL